MLSSAKSYASVRTPTCPACGLAVGAYEPAVFVLGEDVVHSSRAAEPGRVGQPGTELLHGDCFSRRAKTATAPVIG